VAERARRSGANRRARPLTRYKNNIFFRPNRLFCSKYGGGSVQFLVKHFTFLGFEGQNWMLIVAGLIVVFVVYVWKTRDRV
jgi:hypothetical protein